jgi:hypothetical protein
MTNNKEVRQQDLDRLIKLVSELVYYSQIYTVKGVIPVEMQSHEKSWREAQQWLWDNCESKDGEYYLPTPTDASSKVEGEDCSHEPLTDTGVGYYHCPACGKGWTYDEWKKNATPSHQPSGQYEDDIAEEAKELMIKLLPGEEYGENEDAERLYEIIEQLVLIGRGTAEGAELWKAEYDNCRAILTELVYLKTLKESKGKTEEYEQRQPLAWIAAKKFLEKYQHQ